MSEPASSEEIYVVYVAGETDDAGLPDAFDSCRLGRNLFLLRSGATQSRLYHEIKRRVGPRQLFVGKLKENPKFKGMADGSLKWVREGGGS